MRLARWYSKLVRLSEDRDLLQNDDGGNGFGECSSSDLPRLEADGGGYCWRCDGMFAPAGVAKLLDLKNSANQGSKLCQTALHNLQNARPRSHWSTQTLTIYLLTDGDNFLHQCGSYPSFRGKRSFDTGRASVARGTMGQQCVVGIM